MHRFELSDGSSNKFWQISRAGESLQVSFGKIGTAGQTQLKNLGSEAAAIAELEKLVKEKTKKGYVPVPVDGDAAPSPAAAKAPAPAAAPKTKATKADAPKAAAVPDAPVVTPAAPSPPSQDGYVLEERYVGEGLKLGDGSFEALAGMWFADSKDARPAKDAKDAKDAKAFAEQLTAGKSLSGKELHPEIDALVALLEKDGRGELDLGITGAAILLRVAPPAGAMPFLIARFGVVFATDALIEAHELLVNEMVGRIAVERSTGQDVDETAARALAAYEGRVEAPAWKEVLAKVRAARAKQTTLRARAEYNVILRDEALVAEDLAANLARPDWWVTRFVFFATRDRAVQKELSDDIEHELTFEVVGMPAQEWVLPLIAKQNFIVDTVFDLETVAAVKTVANDLTNKHTHKRVREYFAKRPDLVIRGLGPIVAAGGKLAPFAKPFLEATLAAHPTLLGIVAPLLDAPTRALLLAEKKPAPPEAPASAVPDAFRSDPTPGVDGYPKKITPLPDFATAAIAAAPIALEGTNSVLPAVAVQRLLQAIRYVKDAPIVRTAKKTCAPKDLAAFAWELFERWQAAGAPSKEPWGFTALGVLGDDDTARRLTPLIRAWPGESLHARATVGLDVLATIGSDIALMQLHGIGQKLKFKALQEKAREKIAAVAAERGFTAEELADRLVPDFGLGDEGGNILDFGPRTFTIAFDESLKPYVKDATGKVLGDLPKPSKTDDAEKAAASIDRWKTQKKDAKAIAAGQVLRLELAMCNERRWTTDVFRTFLVEHPLMAHLVRRLVWGVYAKGALQSTFRVAEDGSFADQEDDTFSLPGDASIGIIHRLALDEANLAQWGKVFSDYEIIQPFEQLGRPVFTPSAEERAANALDRLGATEVRTSKLLGLEARGWRKGQPQDAGWVWDMWRPLGNGSIAEFSLDGGFCMGAFDMNPTTQKVGAVQFYSGEERKPMSLDQLSPILLSELAREREALRD